MIGVNGAPVGTAEPKTPLRTTSALHGSWTQRTPQGDIMSCHALLRSFAGRTRLTRRGTFPNHNLEGCMQVPPTCVGPSRSLFLQASALLVCIVSRPKLSLVLKFQHCQ